METEPPDQAATLSALVHRFAERLAGATDTPRLDAELLVLHVAGLGRAALYADPDRALPEPVRRRAEKLLERRARGEPLAYLLGTWGFRDLELHTPRGVLVPRPETETLVETVLAELPADEPLRVLDLGTGTGCIALALARARPRWEVVGTDAYPAPLRVARENARRLGLDRVRWMRGDWYAAVADEPPFDAIVSNPPYVPETHPCFQEELALRFEPREALAAGPNGLDALRAVILGAPAHLRPGGLLAVEHGWNQARRVRPLFARASLTAVRTEKDLEKRDRVTLGRRPQPLGEPEGVSAGDARHDPGVDRQDHRAGENGTQ
jgi:release factor glutamine methyltransferase